MKKIIFTLCAVTMSIGSLLAQTFVSTEPQNRNVILEEYTGRNCTYCPDGHRIANIIAAENPGRFWAVNIHEGGFAPTTYPNLKTADGLIIHNAAPVLPATLRETSTAKPDVLAVASGHHEPPPCCSKYLT